MTVEEGGTMVLKIAAMISGSLALSAAVATAGNLEREKAALLSAERWLALVDEEKYGESWEEASELFRNTVKQDQWEQSARAVRKPLAKVISRKVKSEKYTASLPGAPDGEYVVIQFQSSFEHKKSAVETVTLMMDKDGRWRVSGYYIG
jgi:hypothetical protein